MPKTVLYGRPFCPQVYVVRRELERNGIEFDYVDIRQDDAAAARVREINAGFESVPTLVFPDGSTLTEPASTELIEKIEGLGHGIAAPTLWSRAWQIAHLPSLRLIAALFVLAGIMTDLQLLTWTGLAVLTLSFVLYYLKKRS